MSIEAIFLYGSWARGDHGEGSDHDLLMATDEARVYHVTDGHHSMTYYPLPTLKAKAAAGDLFVMHIVREAKVVLDPNDILLSLRRLFQQKTSYQLEILHGADLGWFLVHNHVALSERLGARRIAWAVRTILIARSVMQESPTFAPDKLSAFSDFPNTEQLIAARHGNFSETTINTMLSFLTFERLSDPLGPEATETAWRRRFVKTNNYVGVQLIKSLNEAHLSVPYG